MRYHFKIHKEGKSYWAECIELNGCLTQGDSLEELNAMMSEALNLYLSEPEDSKTVFPAPNRKIKGRDIVEVKVDPNVAFALAIRQMRLKKGKTQKQMMVILGFKSLWSYQRLESAKEANPELTTIAKIKEEFPDFPLDDVV